MTRQRDQAAYFRHLHTNRPLVLPNAWDAASARVIELAGALAIGTTSAGTSWTYGRRDGHQLHRDEMIQMLRYIAQTVNVPVNADIEGGYGTGSTEDVAETTRAVVAAGGVGINLEDSPGQRGEPLLAPAAHAERIRAARQAVLAAGGDAVINARTDVYLLQVGAPETRFGEAVRRANIYRAAGADCLFVPWRGRCRNHHGSGSGNRRPCEHHGRAGCAEYPASRATRCRSRESRPGARACGPRDDTAGRPRAARTRHLSRACTGSALR